MFGYQLDKMKTVYNKNYMSIGVSVRIWKLSAPTTVWEFDRKASRNPQLHIVSNVMVHIAAYVRHNAIWRLVTFKLPLPKLMTNGENPRNHCFQKPF